MSEKITIKDTSFGEVSLAYGVHAVDGENPEQVVRVSTDTGDLIGTIFGTRIRAVTREQIENTCSYDYTP